MTLDEIATIFGMVPSSPVILCRTDETETILRHSLHNHLAKIPPIAVAENWPENIFENAVVVTPLTILGVDEEIDFSIPVVSELSERAQIVLRKMITLARTGHSLSIRSLSRTDPGMSKRTIGIAYKELEEAGLIMRQGEAIAPILLFGRWKPDAAAAQAAGIEIKRYD